MRRRRNMGRGPALCAALLCVALGTGCAGGQDRADDQARASPTGPHQKKTAPPSPPSTAHDERRLGEQAEKAVGAEEIDDNDPLFVESGLERVGDGIHTASETQRGSSLELSVACAGKGKITLSVGPKKAVSQTMTCDGVPVLHRITSAPSTLSINTDSKPGATGMVAWRLAKADE
ncbi:hypothetical protein [Streptomyces sp. NPDC057302]|uniref:hypothetical protein n=1 Tax=Streptomyces sp. NPDC057302 TaxID=3346094 RepID=UPI003626AF26